MSVMECATCDFAWQWPIVRSISESSEYFGDQYATAVVDSYFDKEKKSAICALELEFVESLITALGKIIFDFGSGDGTFCRLAAKAGWKAWGVDPAGPVETFQDPSGGSVCLANEFDNIDGQLKFDAITMWDVVEHLEKPLELIEKVKILLNRGGWLVIETGNFQSTARIQSGPNWWGYQLDHRWYFTPQTITKLLAQAGFGEVRVCNRTLRPWVSATGEYRGPQKLQYLKAVVKNPLKGHKFFRIISH